MHIRMLDIQTLPVDVAPGKTSVLRHVAAPGPARAAILLMPAMGVAARYYDPLLMHLAQQGLSAAVMDLQGLGASSVRASRQQNFGYRELLEEDWPAALRATRQVFGGVPLYLMGHSLGGQLSCLFLGQQAAAPPVAGLILCASGSVYYRRWASSWANSIKLLALTQLAAAISAVLGYFPGHRLRFGGLGGQRMISDWAAQARTGNYSVQGSPLDWEGGLRKLTLPVLSITLDSDTLAPDSAADHLNEKLTQAPLTRRRVPGTGLNHFSWVKQPGSVVPQIVQWLDNGHS